MVGIRLAVCGVMTGRTAHAIRQQPNVEWLHWLFVRDRRAISCDVDVRGDGLYTITVIPLWTSEGHLSETFDSADDAMRRHGQIARQLRASGWLLADSVVVTPAA
jgi:hypothetical protein